MRYAAYRRFLKARNLPGSPQHRARTAAHRSRYAALDRQHPRGNNKKAAAAATAAAAKNAGAGARLRTEDAAAAAAGFRVFADDLRSQLQLAVSCCLALFAGTVAGTAFSDRRRFLRDVAELPGQPGASVLCHRVCPAVVARRDELLAMPSLRPLHEEHLREKRRQQAAAAKDGDGGELSTTVTETSEFTQAVRAQSPAELWSFPASEELEAVVKLAANCQQRMEFEEECRRRNHRIADAATGLVDVPEPGVPAKYVRLQQPQQQETGKNTL